MMHASRVLLWACVVALVPTTAAAQRIEKGEATRLYEDALDHMEQARRMRERDNGAEAEKLLEQARGKLLAYAWVSICGFALGGARVELLARSWWLALEVPGRSRSASNTTRWDIS